MNVRRYYEKVNYKTILEEDRNGKLKYKNIFDIISISHHVSDVNYGSDFFEHLQFIGYYCRTVVDEKGYVMNNFPIARFLIKDPKKYPSITHKTLSLLPYQLIPYSRYPIRLIFRLGCAHFCRQVSLTRVMDYASDLYSKSNDGHSHIAFGKSVMPFPDLSYTKIFSFMKLLEITFNKLLISSYSIDWGSFYLAENKMEQIKAFLKIAYQFSCEKTNPPIRGPDALAYDFYHENGGYKKNARFLFGTPSQHR